MGQQEYEGKIVATYKYGNSLCHVNDKYIAKTPEEREKVLSSYYRTAWSIWKRRMAESEVVRAFHQAKTEAERDELLPLLEAEGFMVVPRTS
ncbi:hypothetical protein [Paenibacillus sp. YYML68]|uniref:hypothetical protein n=1 Tax=Paenibacillus sp. YYML68 TaxID=2909250 RepID=UPI002491FAE0|nr:hypothetical protein [Paenibacillus sp. YYML68]